MPVEAERLREALAPLVESVDKLTMDVGVLTKNVDKLAESVADLRDIVARRDGAVRELRAGGRSKMWPTSLRHGSGGRHQNTGSSGGSRWARTCS